MQAKRPNESYLLFVFVIINISGVFWEVDMIEVEECWGESR